MLPLELASWAAVFGSFVVLLLVVYGLVSRLRSRRQPVVLAEVARAAWDEQAPPEASLAVDVDPHATVSADPGKLQAMFGELFENAVRFGGQDVTVRIEHTDAGFAVADDGPGIPPGEHDRVFEGGYSTAADGDGLGLLMVRTLCLAYGWEVSITGSRDGGTRVDVSGVEFATRWADHEAAPSEQPVGVEA